jgi:hypothetical protein
VNRLYKNIVWTQRANFLDLPTDCPQRDERFGWTGDAQAFVELSTWVRGKRYPSGAKKRRPAPIVASRQTRE